MSRMKKMFVKWIVSATAFVLVAGLMGCGSGETSQKQCGPM
ncbi:hypothetical protein [Anaerotignum sp.]|nr:hypothetical protein [Anaerotignum sp.]